MKLKKCLVALCLAVVVMPATAANSASALKGWYIGGALAHADFDGHYTDSRLPLIGNEYYFGADSVGGSLTGGYRINDNWGMELALRNSGNVANSNAYDAYFSEMAITPVYKWSLGSAFALNLRAGISFASYFVILNRVVPWADDELSWSALGLTAGIEGEWMLMEKVSMTFGYDYVDVNLKPQYDTAYNGHGFYTMPGVNASLSRTAIGMRYSF